MNSDLFNLQGRLALVTGGSRGIGFAIATALAGAGARVILNGRSTEALEAAAKTLRAQGASVTVSLSTVVPPLPTSIPTAAGAARKLCTTSAVSTAPGSAGTRRAASDRMPTLLARRPTGA